MNKLCTIQPASVDELIGSLDELRRQIPAKEGLTEQEIRARIEGKSHGIFKLVNNGVIEGIHVWYEDNGSGYLWLGYCKIKGQGHGKRLVESTLLDIGKKFNRTYVKVGIDNMAVQGFLQNLGFTIYDQTDKVLYMEKELANSNY